MLAGLVQGAEPRILQRVEPEYPPLARAARVQQTVRLSVRISPDGSVQNATVVTGHALLNEAAIKAAQQWKYSSSPFGGTATIEIPFTISAAITGTLSGRVVDEDGRPMAGLFITPRLIVYENGRRVLGQAGLISARTDEQGNYSLALTGAGEYYVMARHEVPANSPGGTADKVSPETFYPGTPDALAAAPVSVRIGATAIADIRVPRMNTVRISGRIHIPPLPEPAPTTGRPVVPRLSVRLLQEEPRFLGGNVDIQNTVLEGRNEVPFDFRGLRPGRYRIAATIATGPPPWTYSGVMSVDAGERNAEDVTLALHRNIEFKGRIVSEDSSLALDQLRVGLLGRGDVGSAYFQPAADGSVRLFNLPEDTFNVELRGPLGNSYVSDIRIGALSVYADGFFAVKDSPPDELQIILKANGGSVSGVVQNAMRQPVAEAHVALVPDGARRANHLFYRSGKSEGTGAFEFRGLQPGEYKVFAFEAAPPLGALESPEFIAQHEQRGVRVIVRDGVAAVSAFVSVIPRP
jgi:TonB family protein